MEKRCIWLNTMALLYLSRGLSTKIIVAEPLTAIDNSFRSWDNFNALRSVQPASQRLDFLGADLPRSLPAKLDLGSERNGPPAT